MFVFYFLFLFLPSQEEKFLVFIIFILWSGRYLTPLDCWEFGSVAESFRGLLLYTTYFQFHACSWISKGSGWFTRVAEQIDWCRIWFIWLTMWHFFLWILLTCALRAHINFHFWKNFFSRIEKVLKVFSILEKYF